MAKTFEEYKADADKQTAESRKKDLGYIDSSADAAIKSAEDTYKKAEANTIVDYASDYERNAVQKLINEKQIAERNANLGLTDSGLNRTQQTAVQLSYANQKGKIDLAKQQALDKLSSDLASYVTQVNNQREADKLGVNQFYDQQNNTIATELYNTDIEDARKRWETEYNAGIELQKAAIGAAANSQAGSNRANGGAFSDVLWYRTGTFDENGNPIFRNSEGKVQAFGAGYNPYTGTKHEDVKHGTFGGKKGYQPDNIRGVKVEPAKIKGSNGITAKTDYTGKTQTIWKCGDIYYLWRGDLNSYVECDTSELSFELE